MCTALAAWFGRGLAGGEAAFIRCPSSRTCSVRVVWPRASWRWGYMSAREERRLHSVGEGSEQKLCSALGWASDGG